MRFALDDDSASTELGDSSESACNPLNEEVTAAAGLGESGARITPARGPPAYDDGNHDDDDELRLVPKGSKAEDVKDTRRGTTPGEPGCWIGFSEPGTQRFGGASAF